MTQRFMPVATAIVFDLEYCDPVLSARMNLCPSIWEIGAVRVDRFANVLNEFHAVIRPPRLDLVTPDVRMRSGVDPIELETAPSLDQVWPHFIEFCGRDNLMSHGASDYHIVVQNVGKWPFRYPYFDSISFIAGLISDSNIQPKSYGLPALCEMFGVDRPPHRGLGDAVCLQTLLHGLLAPR